MAEEGDSSEKTEEPSARRITHARSEGMVARSIELSQVCAMTVAFLALQATAPKMWEKLLTVAHSSFSAPPDHWSIESLRFGFTRLVLFLAPEILIIMVLAALAGTVTTLLQTQFLWSSRLFRPRFTLLNPVAGIRRILSLQNTVQVIKAIAKLAIICPIAYYAFLAFAPQIITLIDVPLAAYFPIAGNAMGHVFFQIMKLMLLLAIADYCWQRYSTRKRLKMSRQELKDERKSVEGDERTRYAIRQKALTRARQRMMEDVKTADVVVTNPTHIAVALRYAPVKGRAPEVVAKGQGHIAERIKAIAVECGIPVIERKPLARALYLVVEVGQQIPHELYAAVAELLAYVYRLKGKNPFQEGAR